MLTGKFETISLNVAFRFFNATVLNARKTNIECVTKSKQINTIIWSYSYSSTASQLIKAMANEDKWFFWDV